MLVVYEAPDPERCCKISSMENIVASFGKLHSNGMVWKAFFGLQEFVMPYDMAIFVNDNTRE